MGKDSEVYMNGELLKKEKVERERRRYRTLPRSAEPQLCKYTALIFFGKATTKYDE